MPKDDQGYWELKYTLSVRDFDPDERMKIKEDEAIEIANKAMRTAFKNNPDIVDWDGPL